MGLPTREAVAFALLASCCVTASRTPRVPPGAPVEMPLPPLPSPEDGGAVPRGAAALPRPVERRIDELVAAAITAGKLPGGVVVIGRHDAILLDRAYGMRSLLPSITPMTLDTVFDLASLTKPLATASTVLALVDAGRVSLDVPLRTYLPELGAAGAGTVRQALLHTAGFVADTPFADYEAGPDEALRKIARRKLRYEPGRETRYSDVGFIVLAEVVRRVTGQGLATVAHDSVFAPLGMSETGFTPPSPLQARAAPTENVDGRWLVGEVHDPRARRLGGVAGHAGVFSTAADVARFAQALLPGGQPSFLSPEARRAYTAPHDVPGAVRALGWDVRSRYSSNRGSSLSPRAFGHGGYTGTSLWVDPEKDLFVVFLSNRVHPDGHGEVNPLAGAIADLAASAVGPDERVAVPPASCGETRTGLDVLEDERFARLEGSRVALLTNAAGLTRAGERDVDLLASAPGVTLVALFAPEHGLASDRDAFLGDGRDARTGLPVYSLYGEHLAPTDAELDGVDTVVVNLPDVGVRFYTYAATLHRVMAVCARRGIRVVVLDRPDPIDGVHVEGPPLVSARGFVNHAELPVRHGMTRGELAVRLDAPAHLGPPLEVVRARGWARERAWGATGLPWVPPSPNLRTPLEATLYPGVALLEATNVSVGRGTETPFEVVGAPFIDGAAFAAALARAGLTGVTAAPVTFTPTSSRHAGVTCGGVKLTVTDALAVAPVTLGVTLATTLHSLYPAWEVAKVAPLLGSPDALAAIVRGASPEEVEATWKVPLAAFEAKRAKYLLYGHAAGPCP